MKLTCIDQDFLDAQVKHLMLVAMQALSKKQAEMGKNVIDPFSATFEMAGFRLDHADWVKGELTRQAQKTLLNHIGDFHQNLLGSFSDWTNLNRGAVVDLLCEKKMILAEVKNKHNTLTGGKRSDLYKNLENLVMPKHSEYKGYTAYFVTIIPKTATRSNTTFTPSDKEKGAPCPENPLIRMIDGASFYELVTGEDDALQQIFRALPASIERVSSNFISPDDHKKLINYFQTAFAS